MPARQLYSETSSEPDKPHAERGSPELAGMLTQAFRPLVGIVAQAKQEQQSSTHMSVFGHAREVHSQEWLKTFRGKVDFSAAEVERLGGDPIQIAPVEALSLQARAGASMIQRASHLPEKLAKRIKWPQKFPPSS